MKEIGSKLGDFPFSIMLRSHEIFFNLKPHWKDRICSLHMRTESTGSRVSVALS